jgi:bifunctional DNA-binding transcriptional regulator/antitoxin component of YhaV-PrlF toxin-antitoxin module
MTAPTLPTRLGAKGRVVLPAAIREAAHLADDEVLLARVDGDGRVILETAAAVRQRIWDAAPVPSGLDTIADVRAMRDDDARLSDEHAVARNAAGNEDSEAVGAALLAHLGL